HDFKTSASVPTKARVLPLQNLWETHNVNSNSKSQLTAFLPSPCKLHRPPKKHLTTNLHCERRTSNKNQPQTRRRACRGEFETLTNCTHQSTSFAKQNLWETHKINSNSKSQLTAFP
ncbi:hypothetical protein, partial [Treponema zioleckii]|uniref:hypothetical protein n=1 Tax=Treponema zioleckii TaxID=331680 RepID=UPI001A917215